MNLKTYLLSIPVMLLAINASAQDKLYKRNGDVIEGKVTEVTSKTVTFRKANNPDGPVYSINKSELESIEYKNGTEEEFDAPAEMRKPVRHGKVDNTKYGNNILALSPVSFNNDGVGLGLSYERVLGKKGIASFYLPLTVAFNMNNRNNYYGSGYNDNITYSTFNAMPGIKFYPTGNRGKVRYAVGPNVLVSYGTEPGYYTSPMYYPNGTIASYNYNSIERFRMGMLVSNSLNICPTPHLYLGLELNLGFVYLNETNYSSSYYNNYYYGGYYDNNDDVVYAQFAFKIGYRF